MNSTEKIDKQNTMNVLIKVQKYFIRVFTQTQALIGWLQVQVMADFSTFQTRVLGLMAYWYTGSAFHQIPPIIFKHKCIDITVSP